MTVGAGEVREENYLLETVGGANETVVSASAIQREVMKDVLTAEQVFSVPGIRRGHPEGRPEPPRRGPGPLRRRPPRAARLGSRGQQGLPRVPADSPALPLRRDPQHVRPGLPPVGRVRAGELHGGLREGPGRHHRRPGPRPPPGRVPRTGGRELLRRGRGDGGRPRQGLVARGRGPALLDRHGPAALHPQGRQPLLQHGTALLRLPVHRHLEPGREPEAPHHLLRVDGPAGGALRQAHARPDHHRPARREDLVLQPPGAVHADLLAQLPPGHLGGDRPPGDQHRRSGRSTSST